MVEHPGDFPPNFLAECSKRAEYFNDKVSNPKCSSLYFRLNSFPGELLRVKKLFRAPLKKDKDIVPAAAFIRRCLTIDPSVRPGASELLQDEWLIEY
jgi:serine/threonine-protein kinase SRPK3